MPLRRRPKFPDEHHRFKPSATNSSSIETESSPHSSIHCVKLTNSKPVFGHSPDKKAPNYLMEQYMTQPYEQNSFNGEANYGQNIDQEQWDQWQSQWQQWYAMQQQQYSQGHDYQTSNNVTNHNQLNDENDKINANNQYWYSNSKNGYSNSAGDESEVSNILEQEHFSSNHQLASSVSAETTNSYRPISNSDSTTSLLCEHRQATVTQPYEAHYHYACPDCGGSGYYDGTGKVYSDLSFLNGALSSETSARSEASEPLNQNFKKQPENSVSVSTTSSNDYSLINNLNGTLSYRTQDNTQCNQITSLQNNSYSNSAWGGETSTNTEKEENFVHQDSWLGWGSGWEYQSFQRQENESFYGSMPQTEIRLEDRRQLHDSIPQNGSDGRIEGLTETENNQTESINDSLSEQSETSDIPNKESVHNDLKLPSGVVVENDNIDVNSVSSEASNDCNVLTEPLSEPISQSSGGDRSNNEDTVKNEMDVFDHINSDFQAAINMYSSEYPTPSYEQTSVHDHSLSRTEPDVWEISQGSNAFESTSERKLDTSGSQNLNSENHCESNLAAEVWGWSMDFDEFHAEQVEFEASNEEVNPDIKESSETNNNLEQNHELTDNNLGNQMQQNENHFEKILEPPRIESSEDAKQSRNSGTVESGLMAASASDENLTTLWNDGEISTANDVENVPAVFELESVQSFQNQSDDLNVSSFSNHNVLPVSEIETDVETRPGNVKIEPKASRLDLEASSESEPFTVDTEGLLDHNVISMYTECIGQMKTVSQVYAERYYQWQAAHYCQEHPNQETENTNCQVEYQTQPAFEFNGDEVNQNEYNGSALKNSHEGLSASGRNENCEVDSGVSLPAGPGTPSDDGVTIETSESGKKVERTGPRNEQPDMTTEDLCGSIQDAHAKVKDGKSVRENLLPVGDNNDLTPETTPRSERQENNDNERLITEIITERRIHFEDESQDSKSDENLDCSWNFDKSNGSVQLAEEVKTNKADSTSYTSEVTFSSIPTENPELVIGVDSVHTDKSFHIQSSIPNQAVKHNDSSKDESAEVVSVQWDQHFSENLNTWSDSRTIFQSETSNETEIESSVQNVEADRYSGYFEEEDTANAEGTWNEPEWNLEYDSSAEQKSWLVNEDYSDAPLVHGKNEVELKPEDEIEIELTDIIEKNEFNQYSSDSMNTVRFVEDENQDAGVEESFKQNVPVELPESSTGWGDSYDWETNFDADVSESLHQDTGKVRLTNNEDVQFLKSNVDTVPQFTSENVQNQKDTQMTVANQEHHENLFQSIEVTDSWNAWEGWEEPTLFSNKHTDFWESEEQNEIKERSKEVETLGDIYSPHNYPVNAEVESSYQSDAAWNNPTLDAAYAQLERNPKRELEIEAAEVQLQLGQDMLNTSWETNGINEIIRNDDTATGIQDKRNVYSKEWQEQGWDDESSANKKISSTSGWDWSESEEINDNNVSNKTPSDTMENSGSLKENLDDIVIDYEQNSAANKSVNEDEEPVNSSAVIETGVFQTETEPIQGGSKVPDLDQTGVDISSEKEFNGWENGWNDGWDEEWKSNENEKAVKIVPLNAVSDFETKNQHPLLVNEDNTYANESPQNLNEHSQLNAAHSEATGSQWELQTPENKDKGTIETTPLSSVQHIKHLQPEVELNKSSLLTSNESGSKPIDVRTLKISPSFALRKSCSRLPASKLVSQTGLEKMSKFHFVNIDFEETEELLKTNGTEERSRKKSLPVLDGRKSLGGSDEKVSNDNLKPSHRKSDIGAIKLLPDKEKTKQFHQNDNLRAESSQEDISVMSTSTKVSQKRLPVSREIFGDSGSLNNSNDSITKPVNYSSIPPKTTPQHDVKRSTHVTHSEQLVENERNIEAVQNQSENLQNSNSSSTENLSAKPRSQPVVATETFGYAFPNRVENANTLPSRQRNHVSQLSRNSSFTESDIGYTQHQQQYQNHNLSFPGVYPTSYTPDGRYQPRQMAPINNPFMTPPPPNLGAPLSVHVPPISPYQNPMAYQNPMMMNQMQMYYHWQLQMQCYMNYLQMARRSKGSSPRRTTRFGSMSEATSVNNDDILDDNENEDDEAKDELAEDRQTPEMYASVHSVAKFSANGRFLFTDNINASRAQMFQTSRVIPVPKSVEKFPGPFSRDRSMKSDVKSYLNHRLANAENGISKDLIVLIKYLLLLIESNGAVSGSSVARILLDDDLNDISDDEDLTDFDILDAIEPNDNRCLINSCESLTTETDHSNMVRYAMLGDENKLLQYTSEHNLWGFALRFSVLGNSSPMQRMIVESFDKTCIQGVTNPLQTFILLKEKRTFSPEFLKDCWKNWEQHVAIMLSNQTSDDDYNQHCFAILGNALEANGLSIAAQICYVLAGLQFALPWESDPRLMLLGTNAKTMSAAMNDFESIFLSLCFEFAVHLRYQGQDVCFPSLQNFKFLIAKQYVEFGLHLKSFEFCEDISKEILRNPVHFTTHFIKEVVELCNFLKSSVENEVPNFEFVSHLEALTIPIPRCRDTFPSITEEIGYQVDVAGQSANTGSLIGSQRLDDNFLFEQHGRNFSYEQAVGYNSSATTETGMFSKSSTLEQPVEVYDTNMPSVGLETSIPVSVQLPNAEIENREAAGSDLGSPNVFADSTADLNYLKMASTDSSHFYSAQRFTNGGGANNRSTVAFDMPSSTANLGETRSTFDPSVTEQDYRKKYQNIQQTPKLKVQPYFSGSSNSVNSVGSPFRKRENLFRESIGSEASEIIGIVEGGGNVNRMNAGPYTAERIRRTSERPTSASSEMSTMSLKYTTLIREADEQNDDDNRATPTNEMNKTSSSDPAPSAAKVAPAVRKPSWLLLGMKNVTKRIVDRILPLPNQMHLPEDNSTDFYFDKDLGKWVDKTKDSKEEELPPPPPMAAMPQPPSNDKTIPSTGSAATYESAKTQQNFNGYDANTSAPISNTGVAMMPPVAPGNPFSRGKGLAKSKYVDVLASSNQVNTRVNQVPVPSFMPPSTFPPMTFSSEAPPFPMPQPDDDPGYNSTQPNSQPTPVH
ncbi:uncharacterized protein LOC134846971 [Symsagittifera roscoffensis]|uniref:uncharacterized protein LOC134846971 n=1 Tax=Symsagittifera roscoffensis TaxID=84072 RepID=UPI00307C7328